MAGGAGSSQETFWEEFAEELDFTALHHLPRKPRLRTVHSDNAANFS
jgi:hypothetical protein